MRDWPQPETEWSVDVKESELGTTGTECAGRLVPRGNRDAHSHSATVALLCVARVSLLAKGLESRATWLYMSLPPVPWY